MKRRELLKLSAAAGIYGLASAACQAPQEQSNHSLNPIDLDSVMAQPILKRELFKDPVLIKSIALLRSGREFMVRVRTKDGVEGLALSNPAHMQYLYPILTEKIAPLFIDEDARDLDRLIDKAYRSNSHYKYQGLPFWVPLASIEFAVLDLLGKVAGLPVSALIGDFQQSSIAVYRANNYRGKSAEESVALIQQNVEESQAKAVKYKIGGRMSRNADFPPGRTEKLIPLVRKTLGDEITIYADSNGSYDVENAIRVGKLLQETNVGFYEEPCPFDHYDDTRQVAEALSVPIAGGEQDSSLWLFKWMIEQDALQVVQPDLFYFGGIIRSMQVARMAAAKGIICTPHISGGGLGYVYMLHFVSTLPNAGPYHEFKGVNRELPFHCGSSSLDSEEGQITVPTGPGWGVEWDAGFLNEMQLV